MLKTQENNSYVVEFDSQAELIYGTDAVKFLDTNKKFDYDTQIIFPKKSHGMLHIDGKDIELKENFAVLM